LFCGGKVPIIKPPAGKDMNKDQAGYLAEKMRLDGIPNHPVTN
jgi:hypothetical protein